MKVRVEISLDVDVAAWASSYGFDVEDQKAIREDVKTHVRNSVMAHFGPDSLDLLRNREDFK